MVMLERDSEELLDNATTQIVTSAQLAIAVVGLVLVAILTKDLVAIGTLLLVFAANPVSRYFVNRAYPRGS